MILIDICLKVILLIGTGAIVGLFICLISLVVAMIKEVMKW